MTWPITLIKMTWPLHLMLLLLQTSLSTSATTYSTLSVDMPQAQEAKEEVFKELMPSEVDDGNVDIPTTEGEGVPGPPLSEHDFDNAKKFEANQAEIGTEEKKDAFAAAMVNTAKGETQEPCRRILSSKTSKRWPNGIVPYTIDAAFDTEFRAIIASAIDTMTNNTCIRWRPKTLDDNDWVYIQTTGASGCNANLGFIHPGYGKHSLKLEGPDACKNKGTVLHEMMHNLGVSHEHNRPDRDTKITMDWSNLQLNKSYNYWKASWGTDQTDVPKCSLENATQGADFSGCVSDSVVTDFGVGYDIKSIMHYQPSFFGVDENKPVFTVDDGTTDIGGWEMTAKDVQKLKAAYGCDGSCGGWQKSEAGGDLTGGGGDALSPCEWILETSPGKGVEINIEQITGANTDCAENYLEVRLGSQSDSQLVGKFCATVGTVRIDNFLVTVKWVRPAETAASSTLTATWTAYEFSCCPKVQLEGLDGQGGSMGTFMKIKTFNNHNLYKQEGLENYMYFTGTWVVGEEEPTYLNMSYSITVRQKGAEYCPETASLNWEYYGRRINNSLGWIEDTDANLRCSDCDKFPDADECVSCCPKVLLEGLDGQSGRMGIFLKNKTFNNHNLYKQEGGENFLYFAVGQWNVATEEPTDPKNAGLIGVRKKGGKSCPETASLNWEYYGSVNDSLGWIEDTDADLRCSDCDKFPEADECVSCCPKVILDGVEGQAGRMGSYLTIKTFNNRNLYKQEDGENYLFFAAGQWNVGAEEPTDPQNPGNIGVKQKGANFCPEKTTLNWEYYGSVNGAVGWYEDTSAGLRCSDCDKFPAAEECATCCDEITMTSMFEEFKQDCNLPECNIFYSSIYGAWKAEDAEFNSRKIYKSVKRPEYCLYLNSWKLWVVNMCADKETTNSYMYAASTKCARQTNNWNIYSQTSRAWVAIDLSFSCVGGNPTVPTVAPVPSTKKPATTAEATQAKTTTEQATTAEATKAKSTTKQTTTMEAKTSAAKTAEDTTAKTATAEVTTREATTAEAQTAGASTSSIQTANCLPCKSITTGPAELHGTYHLDKNNTAALLPDCKDSCIYRKGGEAFCFMSGGFPVVPC